MTNWCKQDCTARGRAEARWHEPRKICELLTLVNAGNLKACKLPPRQPSEAVKYQNETKNQNWEMQRSFSFYTDGLHHVIWFAIWGSCLLSILYVKSTALYTKFLQHISICATTAGGCQLPPRCLQPQPTRPLPGLFSSARHTGKRSTSLTCCRSHHSSTHMSISPPTSTLCIHSRISLSWQKNSIGNETQNSTELPPRFCYCEKHKVRVTSPPFLSIWGMKEKEKRHENTYLYHRCNTKVDLIAFAHNSTTPTLH